MKQELVQQIIIFSRKMVSYVCLDDKSFILLFLRALLILRPILLKKIIEKNILTSRSKAQSIKISQWESKYLNEIYISTNMLHIIKQNFPTIFYFTFKTL